MKVEEIEIGDDGAVNKLRLVPMENWSTSIQALHHRLIPFSTLFLITFYVSFTRTVIMDMHVTE